MPKISLFYGIHIFIFFDDHVPPHFHAHYGEFRALIDINNIDVIKGDLPRRARELVLDWTELHQAELRRNWELCQQNCDPLPIHAIELNKEGTMYWNVVEAKVLNHLEFMVTFADGLTGRVKFLPSHLHGVFEKLKDPDVFTRMHVTDGYVSWPGELDLAPDSMYDEIKRNGQWVLS